MFKNNEVRFYRNGNLELIGRGKDNTLYQLDVTAKVANEYSALSANLNLPLSTWHERLTRVSNNSILIMANQKLVVGLNLSSNHSDSKVPCVERTPGKMHLFLFPQGRTRDDYSNWTTAHFLKSKDEVPDLFLAYTAFLYGELEKELYLEQPEGFVTAGREKEVCRLRKSLYGLKQVPRAWNTKFNEFFTKICSHSL